MPITSGAVPTTSSASPSSRVAISVARSTSLAELLGEPRFGWLDHLGDIACGKLLGEPYRIASNR